MTNDSDRFGNSHTDTPADDAGEPTPVSRGRSRWLWILLRLIVTSILIGLFFYRFSPLPLFEQLGWRLLPLFVEGITIIYLALALSAARWVLVTQGIGARLGGVQSMILTLVAHFFSQFLPASVGGDLVRAWGARLGGLRLRDAVSSVVYDRLFGLAVLACLAIAGMLFLAAQLDSGLPLVVSATLLLGATLGVLGLLNLHRLPMASRLLPGGSTLGELAASLLKLLSRPQIVMGAAALSLLIHMSVLYLTVMLARALGAELSLLHTLTIVPAVMLLANLPISIGGWGVREAGFAGGFSLLGLPGDAAVGTSILFGLLHLVAALPGGALFILRWGARGFDSHPPLS
jgi:glycosyltransferase 2 family protein